MKTARFILILLIPFFCLNSCKKDKEVGQVGTSTVKLSVKIMDGERELSRYENLKVFGGFNFKLSLLKFYISNLTLTDNLGEPHLIKDIILFTPMSDNVAKSTELSIPHNNYQQLSFGFGLDEEQNNSDPTLYDKGNPLSNYYTMYWGMIKYRFIVLEGIANKDSVDYSTSIHLGKDFTYTKKSFDFETVLNVNSVAVNELVLSIEFKDLFDGPGGTIDLSDTTNSQIHMGSKLQDEVALVIMNNLAAATKLEVVHSPQ